MQDSIPRVQEGINNQPSYGWTTEIILLSDESDSEEQISYDMLIT